MVNAKFTFNPSNSIHEAIIVLNIDFMLVGGQKRFLGSIGLDVDVNSFFEKPNLQATSKL